MILITTLLLQLSLVHLFDALYSSLSCFASIPPADCDVDIHPDIILKVWGSYVPPLGSFITYESICEIFFQLVSDDRLSKSDSMKSNDIAGFKGIPDIDSTAMSSSHLGDLPRNITPNPNMNPKNPSSAPLPLPNSHTGRNGKNNSSDYYDENEKMKKSKSIYEGDRFLGQRIRTLCRVIADEVAYSIWNVQSSDPSGNVRMWFYLISFFDINCSSCRP